MCHNIKPLFNFDPPATKEEIHEASLQFIRKLSGLQKPSKANAAIFHDAVVKIEPIVQKLINSLSTNSTPRDREVETRKAHERAVKRFGATLKV